MGQIAKVQLCGGVVAGELDADLPGGVVNAQLVRSGSADFRADNPREVAVPRQRADVAEIGRRRDAAMRGASDDRLVRIAAQKPNCAKSAYPRQ